MKGRFDFSKFCLFAIAMYGVVGIIFYIFFLNGENVQIEGNNINKFGEDLYCNIERTCEQVVPQANLFEKKRKSKDLQELIDFRNELEIKLRQKTILMCKRQKRMTMTRKGSYKPVVIYYPKLFQSGHISLHNPSLADDLDKCSVPCSIVVDYREKHDIILRPQLTHLEEFDVTHEFYTFAKKVKDPKEVLGIISFETAFSNPLRPLELGVGEKKQDSGPNAIDVLHDHLDIIVHSFPFSDIPIHTNYNNYKNPLGGYDYSEFEGNLLGNLSKKSSVLIASFVSKCSLEKHSLSYYRTKYLLEMRKEIKIDEYGSHGGGCNLFENKKILVENEERMSDKFYLKKILMFQKYKFTIAFENSICYNYVTEKLFHGIMSLYSVPIYLGAPNVMDFFPEELRKYKIFIFANNFPDPHDLVEYLHYLDRNETAYLEYFQWRIDGHEYWEPEYLYIQEKTRSKYGEEISFFCRVCELHYHGRKTCHLRKEEYLENSLLVKN